MVEDDQPYREFEDGRLARVRLQLRRPGGAADRDGVGARLGERRRADGRQPPRLLDADRRRGGLSRDDLTVGRRVRHRLRRDGRPHRRRLRRRRERSGPAGGRDRRPDQLRHRPQEPDAGRPRAVRLTGLARGAGADAGGAGEEGAVVAAHARRAAAGHRRLGQPLRRPAGRAGHRRAVGGVPLRQPRVRTRRRHRVPQPDGAPRVLLADARRRVDARCSGAAAADAGGRAGAGRPAAGRGRQGRDRPPVTGWRWSWPASTPTPAAST